MIQVRKKRLPSLIKKLRENMRGHISFLSIIISNNSNQEFKKGEKIVQRGINMDQKGISQHSILSY